MNPPPRYADEPEEPPSIATLCRRDGYEKFVEQRTYCGKPEENCMYRDEYKNKKIGMYRCGMLEKMCF